LAKVKQKLKGDKAKKPLKRSMSITLKSEKDGKKDKMQDSDMLEYG
jgi:hypothetical protein